jgi:hypothetical protein
MNASSKLLQHSIVIGIIGLNSYALARAIKYNSGIGILLALAGFTALLYVIGMFRKLRKLEEETDEQLFD